MELPEPGFQPAKANTKRSVSETGHAKNVANFQDLIAFVSGYGANYNPANVALKLPSLNTLFASGQQGLAGVITGNTAFNNAVNDRMAVFADLSTLATRVLNALEATDAAPAKCNDARTFNLKIQGRRAGNTVKATPGPVGIDAEIPKTISVSQQSYDQLIEHFGGLISVLQSEPLYTPNETDLKVTVLVAKRADMMAKNAAVANAFVAISNERISRNKILYGTVGILEIAEDVKKYVKSVYGNSSPEFSQIKGITFRKVVK